MFKTKVQELCQRKAWPLPAYDTSREGPDHNPRFTSTITVNGVVFSSPSATRTAKLAQNDAAMLAFNYFSHDSPTPLDPPIPRSCSLSVSGPSSFPQPSLCAFSSSGSPGHSSNADDILPTSSLLQPKLDVPETSQISSPVTLVRDTMSVGDHKSDNKGMVHLYKNQLQSYAQKRNLDLPVYSSEWEGPLHAMRFKCKVTIGGHTYESDKLYSTLKDAEYSAAGVALKSLSPGGVHEDHDVLYKNLLQELVQKEGFHLPTYSTNKSGEAHIPVFVSQVEVEGELFTGQEAKSKKQAEMSAAKVAYMALKERKGKSDHGSTFPLSAHQGQAREFSKDCSKANVIADPQHHANPKSPIGPGLVNLNQPIKDKSKSYQSSSFPLLAHKRQAPEFSSNQSESEVGIDLQYSANPNSLVSPGLVTLNQPNEDICKAGQSSSFPLSAQKRQAVEFSSNHSESEVEIGLQHHANPVLFLSPGLVTQNQLDEDKSKKSLSASGNRNDCTEDTSLSNAKSAGSLPDSARVVFDAGDVPSTTVGTPSQQKRVVLYSRSTNVRIEDGGTLMPIANDLWAAYSYPH